MAHVAYTFLATVCGLLLIVFNRAVDSAFSKRDGVPVPRSARVVVVSRVFFVALGVFVITLGVRAHGAGGSSDDALVYVLFVAAVIYMAVHVYRRK